MPITNSLPPRSALFLPASNPRAIEKARTLDADLVILDLEDAVKHEDKGAAREAAIAAVGQGFGNGLTAIRVNSIETEYFSADANTVRHSAADFIVVPKVESAAELAQRADFLGKPLLAMIETPAGVIAAPPIATLNSVAGLIAGVNDLGAALYLPAGAGRGGLTMALQAVVLAARAGHAWAIDGVYNALDDAAGLEAECAEGRAWGFDGKSLIHPNQIAAANAGFGPSEAEIEDARALIAAFTGGVERFRGRMIEKMHLDQAHLVLQRAGA